MSNGILVMTPMLYDVRGQIDIENLGLFSRHYLEETMLGIATIVTSHIAYREEEWTNAIGHITYHLAKNLIANYQKTGPSQCVQFFDYSGNVSGYSIKSLVNKDLPVARGNVEGCWSFFPENQNTDSSSYTKINYDFRYNLSTAVHEDRHIYEEHLYQPEDIFICPRTKNSIKSILNSAKNSRIFDANDAWIVLKSEA